VTDPAWLHALQAIKQERGEATRPVACFSNDKLAAYFCTRWGAGLTTGDPEPFLGYRLSVANGVDPTPALDQLIDSGALAESDVIVLDAPDDAHPWAWKLIENAGTVFGPDGAVLDPRPKP
jgi:hypothetical protein